MLEHDVIKENGLESQIKAKIPSQMYNDNDFKLNSYSLYYKPFATLKLSCQADYSTKSIEAAGKQLGDVSDKYQAVFICALLVFIGLCVTLTLQFKMHKFDSLLIHGMNIIEFGLQITVVYFYT